MIDIKHQTFLKQEDGVTGAKETINRRIKQELWRVKSVRREVLKLNENTLVALLLLSPEVCVCERVCDSACYDRCRTTLLPSKTALKFIRKGLLTFSLCYKMNLKHPGLLAE